MAKNLDKVRAECIKLRIDQRMSYGDIMKIYPVAKGTLHYWLKDVYIQSLRVRPRNAEPKLLKSPKKTFVETALQIKPSGFDLCKNSKRQGDMGLGAAISYFTRSGCQVLLPLSDNQDYDLVIDSGMELRKVQVRTTGRQTKHRVFSVNVSVRGGNSREYRIHKTCNDMQYDLLFVLTSAGRQYLIPKSALSGVLFSLNLGKKMAPYQL